MSTLTLKAPAKLNLSLRVLGKRDDGFHEIDTIMVKLPGLTDRIEFQETGGFPSAAMIPASPTTNRTSSSKPFVRMKPLRTSPVTGWLLFISPSPTVQAWGAAAVMPPAHCSASISFTVKSWELAGCMKSPAASAPISRFFSRPELPAAQGEEKSLIPFPHRARCLFFC